MKKILAVWLSFIIFLGGCAKGNEEGLIKKSTIESEQKTILMIPWPENSTRGSCVKSLVNNYNLSQPETEQVDLIMFSDIESYQAEIRRLTAINQLPDVFLLYKNTEGMKVIESGKLMDFKPYTDQLKQAGFEPAKEDILNRQLLYMVFEQPTLRFYYNRDKTDQYGYSFLSDSPKLLYKLFDSMEENSVQKSREPIQNSRRAIEFLYYLTTQYEAFDCYNGKHWQDCLEQWNKYYWLMDNSAESEKLIKSKEDYPDCFLADSALTNPDQEGEDLESVLLLDQDGKLMTTEVLCWAAAKQTVSAQEAKTVRLVTYLLESDWTAALMVPAENEFEEFGLKECQVLDSETLPVKMRAEILKTLDDLILKQAEAEEGGRRIVELYQQYGR